MKLEVIQYDLGWMKYHQNVWFSCILILPQFHVMCFSIGLYLIWK